MRAEVSDEAFMREALSEAREAGQAGDVPVGAVVVRDGQIVGRGRNRRVAGGDPLAHAEVEAVKSAATTLGTWRLDECTLYVTLEPCPMCAGAIVQSRIRRLVYGATDLKAGAVRTLYQLVDDPRQPHRATVQADVLAAECADVLSQFFADKRPARESS
jgi:tRNA(adenine34) deaminase